MIMGDFQEQTSHNSQSHAYFSIINALSGMRAMKPKTSPVDVKPLAGGKCRQRCDAGYPGLGVNCNRGT